jgi:hypothetical protein
MPGRRKLHEQIKPQLDVTLGRRHCEGSDHCRRSAGHGAARRSTKGTAMKDDLLKLRMNKLNRALKNPDAAVGYRIHRLQIYSRNNTCIKSRV